jgi:U6 snRNA-associated Sm-like protein LSm6
MENGAVSQSEGKDPSSFLSDIIGHPVTVKLNSGVVYKGFFFLIRSTPLLLYFLADLLSGELQSVDGYMNIALEKTEEFVDGVKRRTYGDAFVRGNNGSASFQPQTKPFPPPNFPGRNLFCPSVPSPS